MLEQETNLSQTDKDSRKPGKSFWQRIRLDWLLLIILGVALAIRLLVWVIIPHQSFVIDEQEYFDISSILASGRGWFFFNDATWVRPPLYELILAGIFKDAGPNLYIVRFLQILMSVASVYLLYRTTLLTYGRKTALWTAVLATIAWPFVVLTYLMLTETLFILVFTAWVYCGTEYLSHANRETTTANRFLPRNRTEWLWLIAGGLMLGLAGLTRGQVLSFLPFVLVWFWIALERRWKQAAGAFAIIVVVFGITVAPWALRNYQAYGRFLLDTTGGYNFYLGTYDGRDGHKVSEDLIKIANQADRETLGYQLGMERVLKDPIGFTVKGLKESLDFWQINYGADERIEKGFTKGEVSPLWLIPDTIFNDWLYILAGVFGLFGLAVAPPTKRGLRSFIAIWTLQNMALAFIFFAVSRFRIPVYYFLLPMAAYVLANPREAWGQFKASFALAKKSAGRFGFNRLKTASIILWPLAFALVVIPPYVIDFPVTLPLGIQSYFDQQHATKGDALRLSGDYKGALAEYAQAEQNNPATQIGIGLTYAAMGNYDKALATISPLSQDIAETHIALGYIWHLEGNDDYAEREFESRPVTLDENNADVWAYTHLPISNCASASLQMGNFDWGCVENFHYYQQDKDNGKTVNYRWTGSRGGDGQGLSEIRFAPNALPSNITNVSLRLKGYRPTGLTPPIVQIWANDVLLGSIQTTNDWQTYKLSIPSSLVKSNAPLVIGIGAPTFVPDANDRRELGVMVESVMLNGK